MNLLKLNGEQRSDLAGYYKIARNVSVISACFVLIVSITIIVNFVQLKIHDPIRSPHLEKLIDRVHKDYGDEQLKDTVRAYDFMIRKAHFTSLSFIRFGSYLLLGGMCLFLVALKAMFELKRSLPKPDKFSKIEDTPTGTAFVRYGIICFTTLLILASFILPRVFLDPLPGFFDTADTKTPTTPVKPFASPMEMMRNWPSFRGYRSLGIAYAAEPVVDWNGTNGKNILWKTPIPKPGPNSPVVWDGLVFLAGADSRAREIYCLDMNTGTIIWTVNTGMGSEISIPEVGEDTSLAAPTVAIDGRFVAAIFATGELLIVDFDGTIVANRKLETPDNTYGHASSLVTYQGMLFVQYDHAGGAKLLAFNMATGEKVWEQERAVETSWSSPVLVPAGQTDQLVLSAYPLVIGYDPPTGQALWQLEEVLDGEIGPSPAFSDGRLYLTNLFSVLSCI
ncbi:MAG: PQQ-binding-like beta-propeller repeat protein, partial [bacterium]|nr:PQQ-binding-like beta-propeller repeat protein [bacterium]